MRYLFLLWIFLGCSLAAAQDQRTAADRERDERERPAEVLDFAGIAPGMQVADVFGGAGYYSELLWQKVGNAGKVLLVNNPPYARYARQGLEARFAEGRLAAVEQREVPSEALGLDAGSLDAIVMVMAFHDLYWVAPEEGWPAIDADAFIAQLRDALKPGGVLLIVDHAAQPGTGAQGVGSLHRIDPAFVRDALERGGLLFEAELDVLRNPQDPMTDSVVAPAIRGRTDRFVHRYRKPAAI